MAERQRKAEEEMRPGVRGEGEREGGGLVEVIELIEERS